MTKIIYYYQTFVGLDDLFSKENIPVTHIHLSSIHFGVDYLNKPYIHLNDYPPDNYRFNEVWDDLKRAVKKNINVVIMVGGAGGAYDTLFSDYTLYRQLLFDFIGTVYDLLQTQINIICTFILFGIKLFYVYSIFVIGSF